MCFKETAYFMQIFSPPYAKFLPLLVIATDFAAPEKLLERVEHLHISLMLHYSDLGYHLITQAGFWITKDAHIEAPFSIHEPNHPVCAQAHLSLLCRMHGV